MDNFSPKIQPYPACIVQLLRNIGNRVNSAEPILCAVALTLCSNKMQLLELWF